MHALITGGAGFIGSHLAEELVRRGHQVTVIDDLSTGRQQNVATLESKPGFKLVVDSIRNFPLMEELVAGCDTVFHLAAAVGVRLIVEQTLQSLHTNIRGTDLTLELCGRFQRKTIIASSSEVYGKRDRGLLSEDDDRVLGPTTVNRWSYAAAKSVDEFLALAYHREQGLPVSVVRFFNVIGPRQIGRYGMVVPTFVRQALRAEPITVFGDGRQIRSFTWVGDVVEALMLLAGCPEAAGKIVNVGSSQPTTIEELAVRVKTLTDSPSPVIHLPYHQVYGEDFEDTRCRVPDISRLQALIGFSPKVDLEQMLLKVIEYERQGLVLPAPAPAMALE